MTEAFIWELFNRLTWKTVFRRQQLVYMYLGVRHRHAGRAHRPHGLLRWLLFQLTAIAHWPNAWKLSRTRESVFIIEESDISAAILARPAQLSPCGDRIAGGTSFRLRISRTGAASLSANRHRNRPTAQFVTFSS